MDKLYKITNDSVEIIASSTFEDEKELQNLTIIRGRIPQVLSWIPGKVCPTYQGTQSFSNTTDADRHAQSGLRWTWI